MLSKRIPIRRQSRGELIGGLVGAVVWSALIIGGICWGVAGGLLRPLPGRAVPALAALLFVLAVFIGIPCAGALKTLRELRRRAAKPVADQDRAKPGPPLPRWNAAYGIDPDVPIGKEDRLAIRETYDFPEAGLARRELRSRGYEICINCGYWLRDLRSTAMHCPECGSPAAPRPVLKAE